ncbi:small ribosomal subunit biogenesis GTPase RsgA [Legionella impletisoli]|uniref:Small ribosomal subunit biogenesis GTPase RsgA n=1 Tax=Legionella impletisoli TaxID=343510 RepID=A0A917NE81_9GAMM|nr:small ribosomal subunit biogenesis GTPase RsgA [Legionella impletisoli]GGI89248.1 putative ribosome biogenesis GTPase RsgA [Legionella impletisoli]
MSKRRVSKQQSSRIKEKQLSFQKSIAEEKETLNGVVITRFGSHALIEDEALQRHHCSIRPSLDSLVAGDRVVWLPEGSEQGVVVSRYPRTSVLGRHDKRGLIKPVAANITQVMIVVAPKPELSWPLLDSYLVMTEYLGLQACIVLNKIDLPCPELKTRLQNQYHTLGYPLLFTSEYLANHQPDLAHQLNHHVSVFVGQSGVGKSSLITSVLPFESHIQTGHISELSNLGRHTTSNSTLYHLPNGGAIIDSPGVREFGLWHMSRAEIASGYREFRPHLSQCKFRDCDHDKTPGCAIKEAVKEGKISQDRLNNYVKISTQFSK